MQSSNTKTVRKKRQKTNQDSEEDKHKKVRFSRPSLFLLLMAAEGMKRLLINLRTRLVRENKEDKKEAAMTCNSM